MKPFKDSTSQIALKFFRWFCHPDFSEEIEGDLIERYIYYLEKYGKNKAKWLFIKEVILLFRPNLIKNINQLFNKNSNIMKKNDAVISQKLKLSRFLSILSILAGIALLIFMITVEGEPGGIPLILLFTGIVWFIINQYFITKQKRNSIIAE